MKDLCCTGGQDKCSEMYPGPECPYCERQKPKKKNKGTSGVYRVDVESTSIDTFTIIAYNKKDAKERAFRMLIHKNNGKAYNEKIKSIGKL